MSFKELTVLWFASRSAAIIFVEIRYDDMVVGAAHRKIILPVRCTSLFLIAMGYKYYRRAAAGKPKNV